MVPVLPLYDRWAVTCGVYPVCGPIVTTVRLVGIYLRAYSMCGPIVTCTTVRPVGTYLLVLTPCVAPLLPLYDWWVSTCGTCVAPVLPLWIVTCGAYFVCGPSVMTVWLVGIYLWYLPRVWPQCYHCMTGGYLLVVLTPCVAPLLPL